MTTRLANQSAPYGHAAHATGNLKLATQAPPKRSSLKPSIQSTPTAKNGKSPVKHVTFATAVTTSSAAAILDGRVSPSASSSAAAILDAFVPSPFRNSSHSLSLIPNIPSLDHLAQPKPRLPESMFSDLSSKSYADLSELLNSDRSHDEKSQDVSLSPISTPSPGPMTLAELEATLPTFSPMTITIPTPAPAHGAGVKKESDVQFTHKDISAIQHGLVNQGYREERILVVNVTPPGNFKEALSLALQGTKGTLYEAFIIDPSAFPKFSEWWRTTTTPTAVCQKVIDDLQIKGSITFAIPSSRKPEDTASVRKLRAASAPSAGAPNRPQLLVVQREPTAYKTDLAKSTMLVEATKGADFEESLRLALRSATAKGCKSIILNPCASMKFSGRWQSNQVVGTTCQKVIDTEKLEGVEKITLLIPPSRKGAKAFSEIVQHMSNDATIIARA